MKVSVPSSYSGKVSAIRSEHPPALLPASSPLQPPQKPAPALPGLPAQWWQSFLYGSSDALLARVDALRALALVADTLGKDSDLEISGDIRSGELRKMMYAKFGPDLALHTMQALWLEAAANGEQPSVPAVPNTPEAVAKFFEPEAAVPPHRRESVEDREERQWRASLGGWPGS